MAWAESNAIVFANSVLGARTARYGDFLDICAAITGRAPLAGLHRSGERRGTVVLDVSGLTEQTLEAELTYPLLGHLAGQRAELTNTVSDTLDAVSLGTPHFSLVEFRELAEAIRSGTAPAGLLLAEPDAILVLAQPAPR